MAGDGGNQHDAANTLKEIGELVRLAMAGVDSETVSGILGDIQGNIPFNRLSPEKKNKVIGAIKNAWMKITAAGKQEALRLAAKQTAILFHDFHSDVIWEKMVAAEIDDFERMELLLMLKAVLADKRAAALEKATDGDLSQRIHEWRSPKGDTRDDELARKLLGNLDSKPE